MDTKTISYSLRNYKKQLIFGPIFKTIEVIFELFIPLIMKQIIDVGIEKGNMGDYSYIIYLGLIILGLVVFGFFSTMVCQYLSSVCSQGFGTDLRNRIYKKVDELSLKELEIVGKGNLLTMLTNDTSRLQVGVASLIRLAIRAPLLVIGSLIMCIFVSIKAFYVFLIAVIIVSIFVTIIFILSSKQILKVQKKVDKIVTISNDDLAGSRVIRAFNKEEDEVLKFKKINDEYYKEARKNAFFNALVNPLTYLIINSAAVIIILLAKNYINLPDEMSSGDLLALIQYLNQIMTALLVVFNLVIVFTKALASRKRVNNFLTKESSIKSGNIKEDIFKNGNPLITFKNVFFRYEDGDNYVIKNVSFNINKGETVGIIGGTGSGKTTIIKLIERFFDSSEGDVLFNSHNIKEYDINYLTSIISLVSQKVSIFNGSIKENLTMGNENIDENNIIDALKKADAYSFVYNNEDNLNHEIVEGGKNLSGGQKQRISIARALLKKGEVLILDDSTSALDFLTDKSVRNNIKQIEGLTTIIVSQRATSLTDCDKIIVMYHGGVESIGTYEELLKTSKVYQEIYYSQVKNYE